MYCFSILHRLLQQIDGRPRRSWKLNVAAGPAPAPPWPWQDDGWPRAPSSGIWHSMFSLSTLQTQRSFWKSYLSSFHLFLPFSFSSELSIPTSLFWGGIALQLRSAKLDQSSKEQLSHRFLIVQLQLVGFMLLWYIAHLSPEYSPMGRWLLLHRLSWFVTSSAWCWGLKSGYREALYPKCLG